MSRIDLDNPISKLKFRRQMLEGKRLFKTKGIDVKFGLPYKDYYIAILEYHNRLETIIYSIKDKEVYEGTSLSIEQIDNINSQMMNKIDPSREVVSMTYNLIGIEDLWVKEVYEPNNNTKS